MMVCTNNPLPLACCEWCVFNPANVKGIDVMHYIEPKVTHYCPKFKLKEGVNGTA